jgi:RNase P subunit RPR2
MADFSLRPARPLHRIKASKRCSRFRTSWKGEWFVTLTCPNCGNDQNFQVKTLQMHVFHLEDNRVEVSEESRPAVLEVLCDECETALKFEEFEDPLRKEVLLTIGAR